MTVLQRGRASLAGGGEPSVQRDMEEDPENPAVQLSTATQLRLHLIQIKHQASDLESTITFHRQAPLISKTGTLLRSQAQYFQY